MCSPKLSECEFWSEENLDMLRIRLSDRNPLVRWAAVDTYGLVCIKFMRYDRLNFLEDTADDTEYKIRKETCKVCFKPFACTVVSSRLTALVKLSFLSRQFNS